MSPRRLLLDDGDPSASRADQSAAALHDTSENSSANQQFCLGQSPAALQRVGQSAATTQKGPEMLWPISGRLFHIRYLIDRGITFVHFAAYELYFERLRSRNFCCHIVDR